VARGPLFDGPDEEGIEGGNRVPGPCEFYGRPSKLSDTFSDRRVHERSLRREVAMERPGAHASVRCDLVEGDVETSLKEQRGRRANDALSVCRGVGP
jgi:hypothetical protein